jgi:hypothetical protein
MFWSLRRSQLEEVGTAIDGFPGMHKSGVQPQYFFNSPTFRGARREPGGSIHDSVSAGPSESLRSGVPAPAAVHVALTADLFTVTRIAG